MDKYKMRKKRKRSKAKAAAKAPVPKSYSQFRKHIKTGDIVLFSGKSEFGNWIKFFTRSEWSHVGMAFMLDEWDMLLLYESNTISNVLDIETGTALHGVQLVPLSERMRQCQQAGGHVAVRRLSKELTGPMLEKLKKFRRKIGKRPFEKEFGELFLSVYEGPFGVDGEDLNSLFCSELMAETFQAIGLLNEPPKGSPSNEYTPRDFSTQARPELKLLKGYSLGKEVYLK